MRLDLIDAEFDHLRAAMARVAADALGQQLLDLLARHVQLTQKVQEDAAGHLGEEKMERNMISIGE